MKKIFVAILLLATINACNKADVIEQTDSNAIAFNNPFIDYSTKSIDPSWNMIYGDPNELKEFKVYGTVQKTVNPNGVTNIFPGVSVTKTASGWAYSTATQYWISGNTYNFAGVVAGNNAVSVNGNGLPSGIAYDVATQTDLLYDNEAVEYTSGAKTVEFTFQHILSKVKFTFANEYSIPGMVLKVTGVTIQNALDGVYAVENDKWTPQTTSDILDFGNILSDDTQNEAEYIAANTSLSSKYERLLVPAAYSGNTALNITYTAEVYIEQEENGSKKYILVDKIEKTAAAPHIPEDAVTLEKGHSYNIKITIGGALEKIQFDIKDCGGWTPQTPENELN